MTQLVWTRVPSQTWLDSLKRVTCQGQSPCLTVLLSGRAAGRRPHSRSEHSILSTSLLGQGTDSKESPDSRAEIWSTVREICVDKLSDTHPDILDLGLLLVPGDGRPAHLVVLEVGAGGGGQAADEGLRLLLVERGVETVCTDLASLALVLVYEVTLAVVLVGVAPHREGWRQRHCQHKIIKCFLST